MTMRQRLLLLLGAWCCACCAADPALEWVLAAEAGMGEGGGAFTLETAQAEAARLLQSYDQDDDLFLVSEDISLRNDVRAASEVPLDDEANTALGTEAQLLGEHQDSAASPMRNMWSGDKSAHSQDSATIKRIKVQLPLMKAVQAATMDGGDAIGASEVSAMDGHSAEAEEEHDVRRNTYSEAVFLDDAGVNAGYVESEKRPAVPTLRVRGVILAEKRTDLRLMVEHKFFSAHQDDDQQNNEETMADGDDVATFEAPIDSASGGGYEPHVEVVSEFIDGIGFNVAEDDVPFVEVVTEFVEGFRSEFSSEKINTFLVSEDESATEGNGLEAEIISDREDSELSTVLASECITHHREAEVIETEDAQPSVKAYHSVLAAATEQLVTALGSGHRPPAPDALKKCGAAVRTKAREGVHAVVDPVQDMLQIIGYYTAMERSKVAIMLRALYQTLEALCTDALAVLALWSAHITSACREVAEWCCYMWTTYAEVRIACQNTLGLALLALAGMLFCSVYRAIAAVPDVLFTSFRTFDEVTRAQVKIFSVVLVLVAIYHARLLAWFWVLVSSTLGYYYWSGHVVISVKFK